MRAVYLHGFASGPQSRKAQFFAERFAECGMRLETPDLTPDEADGGFQALTLSGQLRKIEALLQNEPAVVMGSSMGGYLSALYAARHKEVTRVVMLAPAFALARLWRDSWADKLAEWRSAGSIEVFHYAQNAQARIGYGLLEDADQYPDYPAITQPALIFHGTEDPIVPIRVSQDFAKLRDARLVEYRSGHELTDCMDAMWAETKTFLDLS